MPASDFDCSLCQKLKTGRKTEQPVRVHHSSPNVFISFASHSLTQSSGHRVNGLLCHLSASASACDDKNSERARFGPEAILCPHAVVTALTWTPETALRLGQSAESLLFILTQPSPARCGTRWGGNRPAVPVPGRRRHSFQGDTRSQE